ncbi:L,D-transpeptidase family protein [uncultured Psychroserpens sp.]|uniref:L,D-transpeptidase family protein n=1 Tax=uncultured Psychroserpens sp. TaxID=255436 RepID=UPI00260F3FC0|nr:L,D-transpeptidase family protein [uncultured Psychroserpens sp.]
MIKKGIALLFVLTLLSFITKLNFKEAQLKYPRVKKAYSDRFKCVDQLLKTSDIKTLDVYLRAFKLEEQLEVWGKNKNDSTYKLITSYPFCFSSGNLGPKRRRGDYQIPEGFYQIDRFNPESKFHLSLGINYPNQSDKIKSKHSNLGGDIFIHGSCYSIGCIPITDDWIEELYIFAVEAINNGQLAIPVHIFPSHLDTETYENIIKDSTFTINNSKFWKNLKEGYDYFEAHQKLPRIDISEEGNYIFN